jgi:hypothetical protein
MRLKALLPVTPHKTGSSLLLRNQYDETSPEMRLKCDLFADRHAAPGSRHTNLPAKAAFARRAGGQTGRKARR